jgi:energy-coupling factor transport system substrate-specific component
MKIKDIVIIGMMSAVMVAVQAALSFLPNIELVSLLIILFTLIFGWRTLYIIFIFIFTEGLLYGFGLWWFSWLYIWPLLFILTKLFSKLRLPFYWAILSCIFGLIFGALYSVSVAVINGPYAGFASWIQGIVFDIIHGTSNFVITLTLFHPLYFILNKINKQMLQRNN